MQVVELVEIEDSTELNAVFISMALESRMIRRQSIAQQLVRNMRIDFRCADAGVAEHLLNGEQVGTTFQ